MKPTHNTSHRDRRHFSNRIGGSISALVLAAITAGSAHAVDIDYSIEDFSAGTPNYTINGVNNSVTSDSWDPLQDGGVDITPFVAMAGTDYDVTAATRNGVVANGEPTHFVPGGTIPAGQHGCVSTSSNRDFTSNYPLTLVTDNVASLDISLSSMFFALSTDGNPVTAKGSAVVLYSALGDFTDAVQLVSFGIGQTGSWVVTPDFPMVEHTWDTTISVTITDGMSANSFTSQALGYTTPSTVVFTDTAKIRINRAPLVGLVAPDTTTNHVTFLDDIVVTGVPGVAPAAPFVATIAPAVDPDTGYDIQWPSQTGATYTLFTSPDLDTPIESWTVVEAAIAPTPPENTYNVPADGPRRFYAVKEVNP